MSAKTITLSTADGSLSFSWSDDGQTLIADDGCGKRWKFDRAQAHLLMIHIRDKIPAKELVWRRDK